MQDIINKINKALENDIVGRHSFFQLQHFVVNSEPTIQSRMWQCIRELRKRRDDIEYINFEISETQDNIALLDLEVKKLALNSETLDGELGNIVKQENKIKTRQLDRRREALNKTLSNLQQSLQEKTEESQLFLKNLDALQRIEPLRPFDDPDAQREYWNGKLAQDINLRLLLGHPVDVELAKTIFAMPNEAPIKKQLINIVEQLKLKAENKEDIKKLEDKKD